MLLGNYLNKYYKRYWYLLLVALIALIACDWFQLYLPDALGRIVSLFSNDASNRIDESSLMKIIYEVLGVGTILFVGRITWRLCIFYVSKKIQSEVRHEMYLKAERLSVSYYHQNKVGTIMSWFTTDLETLEEYLGWGTLMMIDAIFLTVFTVIKMFALDWALSAIAIIPIILIAVWGALVEKFMGLKWKERQEAFDSLYDFSQESFTGIRVIKAFVKENQQIRAFSRIAKKNKDINIKFIRISVLFDICIEILIAIIVAIINGAGGYFVYKTVIHENVVIFNSVIKMEAGHLVTFTGYFDTLIWPMIAMGQVVTMRSRAKTSYKRISHFLDEDEDIKDDPKSINVNGSASGEITFNHFTFTYPNSNNESLIDISLKIHPGEIIGVVGKVGSGKSTLVNALLRLYNIPNGMIYLDNTDLMDINIHSLRDVVSFVPQNNYLFQDTIRNNIAFSDINAPLDRVIEAAAFADVHSNIEDFKDGYETISGEQGQTLSGGQKQRIAIARAFIKDSPILVMDDSVSAVDVKTEEKIIENIKNMRKGKTTIVVASRVSTVKDFDKIIVLNDGRLEAFGPPEMLLKLSPTYKRMVLLQQLEKERGGNA